MSKITSLAEDLEHLGVVSPKTATARLLLWEHFLKPDLSPEIRQTRLQEFLLLQKKFLGNRIRKIREKNKIGVVVHLTPAKRFVSRGPGAHLSGPPYDAFVRWSHMRFSPIPVYMLETFSDETSVDSEKTK